MNLPMTPKEKAKVTSEINNVWHVKYKGKRTGLIITRSNEEEWIAEKENGEKSLNL